MYKRHFLLFLIALISGQSLFSEQGLPSPFQLAMTIDGHRFDSNHYDSLNAEIFKKNTDLAMQKIAKFFGHEDRNKIKHELISDITGMLIEIRYMRKDLEERFRIFGHDFPKDLMFNKFEIPSHLVIDLPGDNELSEIQREYTKVSARLSDLNLPSDHKLSKIFREWSRVRISSDRIRDMLVEKQAQTVMTNFIDDSVYNPFFVLQEVIGWEIKDYLLKSCVVDKLATIGSDRRVTEREKLYDIMCRMSWIEYGLKRYYQIIASCN